jgi:hypothetical protein
MALTTKKRKSLLDGFEDRVLLANKLICIIASCGRQFFYYSPEARTSYFTMDISGKKVLYRDRYSQKIFDTASKKSWRELGFSNGGTLEDLVRNLAEYIRTAEKLSFHVLGPQRTSDDSNIWGYDRVSMEKVRTEAANLPGMFFSEAKEGGTCEFSI